MGDWFSDFLGAITGSTQQGNASGNMDASKTGLQNAIGTAGGVGSQAQQYGAGQAGMGAGLDQGFQQSVGNNAADFQKQALQTAQNQASQVAQTSAGQGAANAASAARASGVNAGQAGLGAGQQAANTYAQTYAPGVSQGINQYQQGTGMIGNQAQNVSNRYLQSTQQQLGAAQTQAGASGTLGNLGVAQQQSGQQQMNSFMGGVGSLLGLNGPPGMAKGGDVATQGKAFPLLVESGELVESEPYKPDIGGIWDRAKGILETLGVVGVAKNVENRIDTNRTIAENTKTHNDTQAKKEARTRAELHSKYYEAFKNAKTKEEEEFARRKMHHYADPDIDQDPAELRGKWDKYGITPEQMAEGGELIVDEKTEEPKEENKGPELGDILQLGLKVGLSVLPMLLKKGGNVSIPPQGGAIVNGSGIRPLRAANGIDVQSMGQNLDYTGGKSFANKPLTSSNLSGSKLGKMYDKIMGQFKGQGASPGGTAPDSGIVVNPASGVGGAAAGADSAADVGAASAAAGADSAADIGAAGAMGGAAADAGAGAGAGATEAMGAGAAGLGAAGVAGLGAAGAAAGAALGAGSLAGGAAVDAGIGDLALLAAVAHKGGSFIVPPGYDNDTYPLMVEPGTHVKVTPRNKVEEANKLLKKKALLSKMKKPVEEAPQHQNNASPEFLTLLSRVLGEK
jgi:hypothetical protein